MNNIEEEVINTAVENSKQYLMFKDATVESAYKALTILADHISIFYLLNKETHNV